MIKGLTRPVVFFDLETTGIDIKTDEIVQYAGIKIFPNGKKETIEFVCKPNVSIHPEAAKVHGFSNEDVDDLPSFADFVHVNKLHEFHKDADIGGFNCISFDVPILTRQFEESGHKNILTGAIIYDAFRVFSSHFSRNLASAFKYYTGQELIDAHDAMADIAATVAIAEKQLFLENRTLGSVAMDCKKKKETKKRDAFTRCISFNKAGNPIWEVGRNKGTPVQNLKKDYIEWVLGSNFDKDVKKFLKDYIKNRSQKSKNTR